MNDKSHEIFHAYMLSLVSVHVWFLFFVQQSLLCLVCACSFLSAMQQDMGKNLASTCNPMVALPRELVASSTYGSQLFSLETVVLLALFGRGKNTRFLRELNCSCEFPAF